MSGSRQQLLKFVDDFLTRHQDDVLSVELLKEGVLDEGLGDSKF